MVLEKFKEQFLQPLSEVDRLLAIAVPSHAHATFLKNKIPNNTVFLGHFFDENQNSHWLEFLREEGFFRYPPREGRWPQAGYLARMARIDDATAERICAVICELGDVDNRLTRAELLEGISAMPPRIGAKLVDKIEPWAREVMGFPVEEFGTHRTVCNGRRTGGCF